MTTILTKQEGADARKADRAGQLVFPALVAFSVAAATLLLQLVQTRIYAVVFWNHLVYFIICIALLGFGISGTWLSFGDKTRLARFLTLTNAAVGFVVSAVLSSLIIPRMGVSLAEIFYDFFHFFRLVVTYVFAVFPYFFAGWMLGSIYRDFAKSIHFLYFADLVGACVGCLLFLVCVQSFGVVGLVVVCCVLVAVPPFVFSRKHPVATVAALVCVAMLVAVGVQREALSRSIVPEQTKAFQKLYRDLDRDDDKIHEFSEWNSISRIDVVGTRKSQEKRIFIDGDAWTGMRPETHVPHPPWDPDAHRMISWAAPYVIQSNPESVLVIGSGGGVDVYNALRARPKHVDAIEINPTTARIVVEEYSELTHGVFDDPRVNLYTEEGRSFVRRSGKDYDVIVMNSTDTFAALNSGAYVLSENYLYTVEAITDYVTHLKPHGVLSIARWGTAQEANRLFVVCLEAVFRMGKEEPEKHVMVTYGAGGDDYVAVLVGESRFTDEEVATLRRHCRRHKASFIYPGPPGEYSTSQHEAGLQGFMNEYAALRKTGEQKKLLDAEPYDLSPVWDDSPFFFHFDRPQHVRGVLTDTSPVNLIRGHWASFTLFSLLGFLTVAVFLFMLLPLLRRGGARIPHFKSWLAYFSCLGVSFIFVEIALMQRFALLLGHPARSLALVLAGLLFFAGVGSQLRPVLKLGLRLSMGLLVVVILVATFLYPFIIKAALGWLLWQRGLLTVGLVAPLGFFMGMPFPTGIRTVSGHGREAVPWMWGVNGGTTVLGSVLAIILAISFNFTTVFVLAAAGYALALVLYTRVLQKPAAN